MQSHTSGSAAFDWEAAAKYYCNLRTPPSITEQAKAIDEGDNSAITYVSKNNSTKRRRWADPPSTDRRECEVDSEYLIPPDDSTCNGQVEVEDRIGFLLKRADENPDSYEALQQLASALLETDRLNEAEAALNRLLTEFPMLFGFWKKLGKLHVEKNKNWTAAEEVLERATQFVGHNPLIWVAFIGWQRELQSSPQLTRILIDKALRAAGRHWKAWPLWEVSIDFEEEAFLENREKWISALDQQGCTAPYYLKKYGYQGYQISSKESTNSICPTEASYESDADKYKVNQKKDSCCRDKVKNCQSKGKTLPNESIKVNKSKEIEAKPNGLAVLAKGKMVESVKRLRRLFWELHGTPLESSDLSWDKFNSVVDKLGTSILKTRSGSVAEFDDILPTISPRDHHSMTLECEIQMHAEIKLVVDSSTESEEVCGFLGVLDFLEESELLKLQERIVEHSKTKRGNEILKHLEQLSSLAAPSCDNSSTNNSQKSLRQTVREKVLKLESQHAVDEICWDIRRKRLEATFKEVEKIAPHEKAVHRWFWHPDPLTPQRLQAWREFLKFAGQSFDPEYLQLLQKRCLEVCCSYTEFWRRCANQRRETWGIDSALGLLEFAVKLMPRRKDVALLFAQQLERYGFYEKSARELQRIIEGPLNMSNVRYFLAWVFFLIRHPHIDATNSDAISKIQEGENLSDPAYIPVQHNENPNDLKTNDNSTESDASAAALLLLEEGISRAEGDICIEILHTALATMQFMRLGDCRKALTIVVSGRNAVPGSLPLLRLHLRLLQHQHLKQPIKLLQMVKTALAEFTGNEKTDTFARLQGHKLLVHYLGLLSGSAEEIECAKDNLSFFMEENLTKLTELAKTFSSCPLDFETYEDSSEVSCQELFYVKPIHIIAVHHQHILTRKHKYHRENHYYRGWILSRDIYCIRTTHISNAKLKFALYVCEKCYLSCNTSYICFNFKQAFDINGHQLLARLRTNQIPGAFWLPQVACIRNFNKQSLSANYILNSNNCSYLNIKMLRAFMRGNGNMWISMRIFYAILILFGVHLIKCSFYLYIYLKGCVETLLKKYSYKTCNSSFAVGAKQFTKILWDSDVSEEFKSLKTSKIQPILHFSYAPSTETFSDRKIYANLEVTSSTDVEAEIFLLGLISFHDLKNTIMTKINNDSSYSLHQEQSKADITPIKEFMTDVLHNAFWDESGMNTKLNSFYDFEREEMLVPSEVDYLDRELPRWNYARYISQVVHGTETDEDAICHRSEIPNKHGDGLLVNDHDAAGECITVVPEENEEEDKQCASHFSVESSIQTEIETPPILTLKLLVYLHLIETTLQRRTAVAFELPALRKALQASVIHSCVCTKETKLQHPYILANISPKDCCIIASYNKQYKHISNKKRKILSEQKVIGVDQSKRQKTGNENLRPSINSKNTDYKMQLSKPTTWHIPPSDKSVSKKSAAVTTRRVMRDKAVPPIALSLDRQKKKLTIYDYNPSQKPFQKPERPYGYPELLRLTQLRGMFALSVSWADIAMAKSFCFCLCKILSLHYEAAFLSLRLMNILLAQWDAWQPPLRFLEPSTDAAEEQNHPISTATYCRRIALVLWGVSPPYGYFKGERNSRVSKSTGISTDAPPNPLPAVIRLGCLCLSLALKQLEVVPSYDARKIADAAVPLYLKHIEAAKNLRKVKLGNQHRTGISCARQTSYGHETATQGSYSKTNTRQNSSVSRNKVWLPFPLASSVEIMAWAAVENRSRISMKQEKGMQNAPNNVEQRGAVKTENSTHGIIDNCFQGEMHASGLSEVTSSGLLQWLLAATKLSASKYGAWWLEPVLGAKSLDHIWLKRLKTGSYLQSFKTCENALLLHYYQLQLLYASLVREGLPWLPSFLLILQQVAPHPATAHISPAASTVSVIILLLLSSPSKPTDRDSNKCSFKSSENGYISSKMASEFLRCIVGQKVWSEACSCLPVVASSIQRCLKFVLFQDLTSDPNCSELTGSTHRTNPCAACSECALIYRIRNVLFLVYEQTVVWATGNASSSATSGELTQPFQNSISEYKDRGEKLETIVTDECCRQKSKYFAGFSNDKCVAVDISVNGKPYIEFTLLKPIGRIQRFYFDRHSDFTFDVNEDVTDRMNLISPYILAGITTLERLNGGHSELVLFCGDLNAIIPQTENKDVQGRQNYKIHPTVHGNRSNMQTITSTENNCTTRENIGKIKVQNDNGQTRGEVLRDKSLPNTKRVRRWDVAT